MTFDPYAEQYDAWYDSPKGKALLSLEVACLRPLVEAFPQPHLEIGVGTGRFAEKLGILWGVDPSQRAIGFARRRGINAIAGTGEQVPFEDGRFGAVLIAFTLCFVRDPLQVLGEARRVLRPQGGLVLGLLLRGTPWADWYAQRGREGHPLYQSAHFFSHEDVEALLAQSGFKVSRYRSTLFQRPGLDSYDVEPTKEGYVPGAGFVGIAAVKDRLGGALSGSTPTP